MVDSEAEDTPKDHPRGQEVSLLQPVQAGSGEVAFEVGSAAEIVVASEAGSVAIEADSGEEEEESVTKAAGALAEEVGMAVVAALVMAQHLPLTHPLGQAVVSEAGIRAPQVVL